MHRTNENVCTIDIEKFYDSTKEKYVYDFFRYTMKMETNIATILTKLLTYENRIPTGTPTSQLIAFLSYKDVFLKINELCQNQGITFSLYVDDITLSSNSIIKKKIKVQINQLLNLKELNIKKSKTKFFSKNTNKSVTGTIIDTQKNIKLENKKRKEIIELYKECINKETYSIEKLVKLNGKINDARQVESNIFSSIFNYLQKHKEEIKKYNQKQYKRKNYYNKKIY